MKSIKLLIIFVIAVSFVVTSCKKDKEEASKKGILTAKKWRMSSAKYSGIEVIKDCQKDNTAIFGMNDTCIADPGVIRCDTTEEIQNLAYSLSSDSKFLTIEGNYLGIKGDNLPVTITESSLIFTVNYGIGVVVVTFLPL